MLRVQDKKYSEHFYGLKALTRVFWSEKKKEEEERQCLKFERSRYHHLLTICVPAKLLQSCPTL